jgi:hypothetical protein
MSAPGAGVVSKDAVRPSVQVVNEGNKMYFPTLLHIYWRVAGTLCLGRRAMANKLMMYGIIAMLLGAIGIIAYFKLIKKDKD